MHVSFVLRVTESAHLVCREQYKFCAVYVKVFVKDESG